jgi:hypothetical protein
VAIPIAPPNCSAVADTPEACPWSAAGTVSSDTGSFTVRTSASPTPKANSPGSIARYELDPVPTASSTPDTISTAYPVTSGQRPPILSYQRPASGAMITMGIVVGSSASPARPGDICRFRISSSGNSNASPISPTPAMTWLIVAAR